MIVIPARLVERIADSAERAYPDECCGLLIGRDDGAARIAVTCVAASRNVAEGRRRDSFEVDPKLRFDLMRELNGGPDRIVGHYHSHPDHPAQPSARDAAMVFEPDLVWVIVSVADGRADRVTAHAFDTDLGGFREIRIHATGRGNDRSDALSSANALQSQHLAMSTSRGRGMLPELIPDSNYLLRMADGTIKQVNPFTGTEVWTVPGRANRPLNVEKTEGKRLDPGKADNHCAFCPGQYLQTPPEKARLVMTKDGYQILRLLKAEEFNDTVAEFRRVPNMFEIVSYDYWHKNFGYGLPETVQSHMHAYLSTELGRRHVLDVVDRRLALSGMERAAIKTIALEDKLRMANGFFGGGHELIVARRHYVEGAEYDNQLASSGSMTPEEHYQYIHFTIDAVRDIYLTNRYVRYVAVFQNWLRPAGASFDHLHKQLVAIDERGVQNEVETRLARANPNIYNEAAINFAGYRNLVFAENDHAIAFVGFGHRFPTLEVFSKSERTQPWNHSADELRGMSDIIHACHAAMGPDIPCNEEWYYKPPDADVAMPWRVLIKWRISTAAGFEGGTKIYVNTIDPESLRDKVVPRLFDLKNEGRIALMKIAFECDCVPNCLKYNPAVRDQMAADPAFPPLSGEARADK